MPKTGIFADDSWSFSTIDNRPPRPLDYERPRMPRRPLALALLTISAAVASGVVAMWCAAHCVHVYIGLRELNGLGPICGNYVAEVVAGLGMPIEIAFPLGIFSGGCAMVAAIQSIRFFNAARSAATVAARRIPLCAGTIKRRRARR